MYFSWFIVLIMKVSQILKIRVHDWKFWFDLLSSIPWTFIINRLTIKHGYMRLLRLNHLLKLYKVPCFTLLLNSLAFKLPSIS